MPNISTPLSYGEGFELNRNSWQAAGLVGWWPLGAYPDARDKSLFGRNSQTVGEPTTRNFAQRRGLDFDDIDDYVNCGDINGIVNAFTISMWTLMDAVGGELIAQYSVATAKRGFEAWLTSSRTHIYVYYAGSPYYTVRASSATVATGIWYHWVATFIGGAELNLYTNGVLDNGTLTNAIPSSMRDATENVTIGSTGVPNYFFDGIIDDVRIYNRALSANEVAAIYNETKDGSYGDLAAKPQQFYNIPFTTSTPPAEEDTIDKLLIENDDVLLLEDGTYVLLQSATVEGPLKPQSDIRVGPSLEFDVAAEVIQENLRGGGRITVCNGGIVSSAWSSGPRLVPNTQVVVNKYDNRLVRGVNQGDRIAKRV